MKRLSPREHQVLSYVATGAVNATIRQRLGVQDATIKRHLENAMRKLDAATRAQLVHRAWQEGILTAATPLPERAEGICGTCGQSWPMRGTGCVQQHPNRTGTCPGSDKPPAVDYLPPAS